MARWLFKEEPSTYSFDDLLREGRTSWTGIANPLAKKYLKQVRKGDEIFLYQTGSQKSVVGIMKAVNSCEQKDSGDLSVVVAPLRRLQNSVPLSLIKADPAFADWELTRIPRLSIMPVTASQWRRVLALARELP